MKGIPSSSSLPCFLLTEDGTRLQSTAEGAESVRERERENTTLLRPQRFPARNRGRFCSFCLALPDTEPSLDLGVMGVKNLRVKTSQDGDLENCHFISACIHQILNQGDRDH